MAGTHRELTSEPALTFGEQAQELWAKARQEEAAAAAQREMNRYKFVQITPERGPSGGRISLENSKPLRLETRHGILNVLRMCVAPQFLASVLVLILQSFD